jgi:Rap1a immunity proteins
MKRFIVPAFACLFLMAAKPLGMTATPSGPIPSISSLSAGELQGMCQSTYDVEYGWCAGYVTALAEANGGACMNAPVRSQQYVDIFKSYMEVFPEARKAGAPEAVSAAMARAFPCR